MRNTKYVSESGTFYSNLKKQIKNFLKSLNLLLYQLNEDKFS